MAVIIMAAAAGIILWGRLPVPPASIAAAGGPHCRQVARGASRLERTGLPLLPPGFPACLAPRLVSRQVHHLRRKQAEAEPA
jgi:hypothetical protein